MWIVKFCFKFVIGRKREKQDFFCVNIQPIGPVENR